MILKSDRYKYITVLSRARDPVVLAEGRYSSVWGYVKNCALVFVELKVISHWSQAHIEQVRVDFPNSLAQPVRVI
ncbi:hypothetical protein J6590_020180 [Homalodisca vitripennis]|nr:hypothetical protein J6590_020180 [Homalodisca vitripennis]